MVSNILSITALARQGLTSVATSNRSSIGGADAEFVADSTVALDAMTGNLLGQGFTVGNFEIRKQWRHDSANATATATTAAFVIRDVLYPDLNITAADFYVTTFADGTGTAAVKHHLADHAVASRAAQGSAHAEHDGPGFKYNFRIDTLAGVARS